ncbi:aldose 1-epimerase [Gillisia mitskevichiae]|uniref:Aldose 1-epimerase n=1 Tax=Gillisia mitskevichiae TaxID=270921 RepID=A0A495PIZ7_9FLAO|nr:aldose epimerase family protein [Gillisia mitskevichiae]RKS50714.1 aldose 1-epimerase [Gillisia mitskevichiae]
MNHDSLEVHTLKNSKGTELSILNLGASLFSFYLLDKNDKIVNILVGPRHKEVYASENYIKENKCFGASIGRYAGRISEGEFMLGGKAFKLFQKNGVHLHGGFRGLQHKIWEVDKITEGENPSIKLSTFSEDGEEGYPGNLKVQVIYTLTEENELVIEYQAETDKRTPVNLTNHAYFNLSGRGDVRDHELYIASKYLLEVDEKLRPSGKYRSFTNDVKSFQTPKIIGDILLDDTFVFNSAKEQVKVKLFSEETGIELSVKTNQPAAVVYIPVDLPDLWEYQTEIASQSAAICIELQNFPDAPNHDNFPNSILDPKEKYSNRSSFQFTIKR